MLDLKRIRTDFDTVAAKLKNRGVSEDTLTHLKELDEKRRALLVQSEELKAERNIASAAIAQAKRQKEDATQQIADMQKVSADIKTIDNQLVAIDQQVTDIITVLPNTPHDSVPVGADEEDNVEIRRWGTPRDFDFEVKAHWDLGEDLDILDWERGAKVTGARSYSIKILVLVWSVLFITSCWMNISKKVIKKSSHLTWLTTIPCLVQDNIQSSKRTPLN